MAIGQYLKQSKHSFNRDNLDQVGLEDSLLVALFRFIRGKNRRHISPRTIVVALPEIPLAELVKTTLERENFQVTIVADWDSCLCTATLESPDLVIADVSMVPPGDLPWQACAAVIPVIVLEENPKDARSCSAWDGIHVSWWLRKPINPMELVTAVKMLLRDVPPAAPSVLLERF